MERKLLLLGLLRSQAMYGYQINEMIDAHLGTSIHFTKPTAYRFLSQLMQEGLVTFSEEKEGNRPTRRVYSITSAGENEFQEMLRDSLKCYQPSTYHSTIGIAFMDTLQPTEVISLLLERRASIKEHLDGLTGEKTHHGGMGYVISHQVWHLETELQWLDEIIRDIEISLT